MNNVSIPRWHVLGAGAIGGLWAARLAQAEIPVTLLLKNRCAVERFDESPLRLESASGIDEPEVHAVAAIDCADHIDFLLVTTKAYATLDALAALEPRLAPTTHILLLQNGIVIQQQVAER